MRNKVRTHHVHVVKEDSIWFKRHIAFRDELIKNKKTRIDYQNLKFQLAKKDWKSGDDYSNAKTEFITSIEKRLNAYR